MSAWAVSFAAYSLISMGTAVAQPISGGSGSSVEWWTAYSSLIVRGVIEDVVVHDPNDKYNRYQTLTVRVLETIKGPHSDRLQFVHNHDFGGVELSKLRAVQQELLFFLEPWERSIRFHRSTGGYAYARFPYVVKIAAVLSPHGVSFAGFSLPPRTADLTQPDTPDQLIDSVKAYLSKLGERRPGRDVTIDLPPEMRGGYVRVAFIFPADANPEHPQAALERPTADFAVLKERFGKSPPGTAKPPYLRSGSGYIGVYALELMAADCDVIVRGVIDDWFFIAASEDPTGPACGVRLRVLETLKGDSRQQVNFYLTDARDLAVFGRKQQELIVFLRDPLHSVSLEAAGYQPPKSASHPVYAFGLETRANLWDDSVIVLDEQEAEALYADLTWHRKPDEILDRLRVVIGRKETTDGFWAPVVFRVSPPASVAAGSSIAGNEFAVVHLSVDQELEADARKWAVSDNPDLRWLGARAMIYFKSDANAALLRGLLNDTATWDRREMLRLLGSPLDHRDQPQHLVRWEAWQVLNGWGYDPPKPDFGAQPTNR
jgi:hypothetical protein